MQKRMLCCIDVYSENIYWFSFWHIESIFSFYEILNQWQFFKFKSLWYVQIWYQSFMNEGIGTESQTGNIWSPNTL